MSWNPPLGWMTMAKAVHRELDKLGLRKPPVIPFLSRGNPINKYLGIILSRMGLRRK